MIKYSGTLKPKSVSVSSRKKQSSAGGFLSCRCVITIILFVSLISLAACTYLVLISNTSFDYENITSNILTNQIEKEIVDFSEQTNIFESNSVNSVQNIGVESAKERGSKKPRSSKQKTRNRLKLTISEGKVLKIFRQPLVVVP